MKTILAGTLLLFSITACSSKSQQNTEPTNHSKDHAKVSEVKKEVWTCPMHSQIRKDHSGQCPICGMNLVKADEVDSEKETSPEENSKQPDHHTSFTLPPERQQMIGVKFGVAEKKPLFKTIRVAGRLAFDPELYTAQNEYSEALRQLTRVKDSPLPDVKHSAERMVHSSKLRLKVLGLSDSQIAQIGTGENSGSNLIIHRPGQQVWVYADIYEMDLPNVHADQSAEITAGFLGGKILAGKVVSVDRVINPNTRTAKARILVSEGTTLLRPESYVDVSILAPLGEQVSVPFDAVLDTGRQSWVFVADEKNHFIPRLITVKFYSNEEIAVGSGLQGGERIVTSANFLIDSESRLKDVAAVQTNSGTPQPSCPKDQHWDTPMAMCMPD